LLSKPVTATVIRIEEIKKSQLTTIFTANGLEIRKRLLTKDEEPNPSFEMVVVSVEEKTAKIRAEQKVKVGDKISSRYKPKFSDR
jgi:hypothetical protein